MDINDVDSLLDEVAAVTRASAPDAQLPLADAADAVLADWLVFARVTDSFPAPTAAPGACVVGMCRPTAIHPVSVVQPHGGALGFRTCRVAGYPGPVHVCSPYCLHVKQTSSDPRGFRAAPLAGTLFLCARHRRVHGCSGTPVSCRDTYTDALGFARCVFSGNTVGSSEAFGFGEGAAVTGWVGDLSSSLVDVPSAKRAKPQQRKARQSVLPPAPAPSRPAAAAAAAAADDSPRAGLFADDAAGNGFGQGLGQTLDDLYGHGCAAVDLLLFGAERGQLEAERVRALRREADRKMLAFLADEVKGPGLASLDAARRKHAAVMGSRQIFSPLLLPAGATGRLRAYYACVLCEFLVALYRLTTEVQALLRTTPHVSGGEQDAAFSRTDGALERVHNCPPLVMACNCLYLLAVDFSGGGAGSAAGVETALWPEAAQDPVLARLPESATLNKLGISEHECTGVRKDVRLVFSLAEQHGLGLGRLRVTALPLHVVMWAGASVIALFLAERQRRMKKQ